jgi:hypothetical protein
MRLNPFNKESEYWLPVTIAGCTFGVMGFELTRGILDYIGYCPPWLTCKWIPIFVLITGFVMPFVVLTILPDWGD